MIVCICHNVSDKAIRQALEEGVASMHEIRAQLGVGSCCGKCNAFAKTLVRAHLEDLNFATTEVRRIATSA
jgi:bacterioferritin-associated ferredoxin